MKKLMFAAATLAAGFAVADIVSSDIVGYAKNTLDDNGGAVMTGAQFLNFNSTGDIALASIKPTAAATSAEDLAGSIEIQTLDNAGRTLDSYVWNGTGWEGDDNTVFAAGAGLWVFNQIGDAAEVSLRIPAPELN